MDYGFPDSADLTRKVSELSTFDGSSDLPDVLTPVTLLLGLPDGASAEVPSRVCDLEDLDGIQCVVVDRPDLSSLAEPGTFPREDEELTLLWARPSDRIQLRVTAVAGNRSYGPVWVLTPSAAATRQQRREFFRIPLNLAAVLTPVVDEAGAEETPAEDARAEEPAVRATLVEVSEGGAVICCEAGLPEVGTLVGLSFTLQDKTITADAEVLRHTVLPTGRPSAALRFLDPAAYGDDIRRFAFAEQRTRARSRLT